MDASTSANVLNLVFVYQANPSNAWWKHWNCDCVFICSIL